MLETNLSPVFIQHIKPLFFYPTKITEIVPALSTGVKNDFFLSGNPTCSYYLLSSQTHFAKHKHW